MNDLFLPILFFLIAAFYSSVGFGGGSSYLAVLSLVMTGFYEIRTLALVLNVVVVTIGTLTFVRKQVFDWSSFWPFILLSVPLAFLGARLRLSETLFFILLGSALVLAAIVLVFQSIYRRTASRQLGRVKSVALGGGIGLLSGVVGIGGGIFLSPVLNVMRWKDPKVVAALASVFILVNSLAGISGLLVADTFDLNISRAVWLLVAVVLGGWTGSRLSIRLNIHIVRVLTAILVMYVGARIILDHGFGIAI